MRERSSPWPLLLFCTFEHPVRAPRNSAAEKLKYVPRRIANHWYEARQLPSISGHTSLLPMQGRARSFPRPSSLASMYMGERGIEFSTSKEARLRTSPEPRHCRNNIIRAHPNGTLLLATTRSYGDSGQQALKLEPSQVELDSASRRQNAQVAAG